MRANQPANCDPLPQRATERAAKPAHERVATSPQRGIRFGEDSRLFQLAIPERTFRFQGHRVDSQVCAHLLAPLLQVADVAASLVAVPVRCAGHVCIMSRRRSQGTVRITRFNYGFPKRCGPCELRGEAI